MTSSTVTRIIAVTDAFPPALAELHTSEGLKFPIFDAGVLIDAKMAHDKRLSVLLLLTPSSTTRAEYVRKITPIDVDATSLVCLWCQSATMIRHQGSETNGHVDQFECQNCWHRLYLGPVARVVVELPSIARARLTLETDGMFALDHDNKHAICMDECPADAPQVQPWRGILAELSYSRDGEKALTHLKLIGAPFNGRTSYQVI